MQLARPKGLGPVNLLGYSWAGVKVGKEVILYRPRHTEKASPKYLKIFHRKIEVSTGTQSESHYPVCSRTSMPGTTYVNEACSVENVREITV